MKAYINIHNIKTKRDITRKNEKRSGREREKERERERVSEGGKEREA